MWGRHLEYLRLERINYVKCDSCSSKCTGTCMYCRYDCELNRVELLPELQAVGYTKAQFQTYNAYTLFPITYAPVWNLE